MRRFVAVLLVVGLALACATVLVLRPPPQTTTATWISAVTLAAVAAPAPPDARDEIASVKEEARDRERSEAALVAALQAYDQRDPIDFSVVVTDHTTDRTFAYRGDDPFSTASIVKVEILGALLLQADQEDRPLSTEEHMLAKAMIEESDNDAASALWDSIDDGTGLAAANATFGLTSTTPGDDGYWGLTTTTAQDQAHLIDQVLSPSGPLDASSAYLRGLMADVAADQSWGISAAAVAGEVVEVKNGWLARSDQDDRWTINSIGQITGADSDATIVVLSRGHASMEAGIAAVEAIVRLTREYLHW